MKKRWKGLAALWLALILAVHAMPGTVIADASLETATMSDAVRMMAEEGDGEPGTDYDEYVWVYKGEGEITSENMSSEYNEGNISSIQLSFDTPLNQQEKLMSALSQKEGLTGWNIWAITYSGGLTGGEKKEEIEAEGVITSGTYSGYVSNEYDNILLVPIWKEGGESSEDETQPGETSSKEGQVWVYKGIQSITSTSDLPVVRDNVESRKVLFDTPLNEQRELTDVLPAGTTPTGWKLWLTDSGCVSAEQESELAADGVISYEEYTQYSNDSNNIVLVIPVWEEGEEPSKEKGEVWVYKGSQSITSISDLLVVRDNVESAEVQFDIPLDDQIELAEVLPAGATLTGWKLWLTDSGYVSAEQESELAADGVISYEEYTQYSNDSNNIVLVIPVWEEGGEPSKEKGEVWVYKGSQGITSTSDLPVVRDNVESAEVQFDTPLNDQIELTDALPAGATLTGWKLWSADSGYASVKQESEELAAAGVISYEQYSEYSNGSNNVVLVIPVWEIKELSETQISDSGTYTLKKGDICKLGQGNWTVDGDSTVYRGGRVFYAGEAGNYTFHKE